ncbi:MAG: hypothetical protein QGG14_05060 [Planctomycetota bacterium]|jgi:hypothetical protein|nr:hypothetical protein [Planctomycetota bacterium]
MSVTEISKNSPIDKALSSVGAATGRGAEHALPVLGRLGHLEGEGREGADLLLEAWGEALVMLIGTIEND